MPIYTNMFRTKLIKFNYQTTFLSVDRVVLLSNLKILISLDGIKQIVYHLDYVLHVFQN